MCMCVPYLNEQEHRDLLWHMRLTEKYGIAQPMAPEDPTESQTIRTRREANAILARVSKPVTL